MTDQRKTKGQTKRNRVVGSVFEDKDGGIHRKFAVVSIASSTKQR